MVIKPLYAPLPLRTDIAPLDVRQALLNNYQHFHVYPHPVQICLVSALRLLIKETQINEFLTAHANLKGVEFIEKVFEELTML